MKRLLVLMSAVVTAMGASVALAAESDYATSFESGEPGVEGSTFIVNAAEGWSFDVVDGDTENPQLAEQTGPLPYGKALVGAPVQTLTRRDDAFLNNEVNTKYLNLETGTNTLKRTIGNGQVFVDQLVKFTGFEEIQETFDAGTKIAVWMSAIETEGEEGDADYVAGETNLYVAVGTGATTKNVKLDFAPVPEQWYRLTIKSIGNAYADDSVAAQMGFKVFIDGMPVSIVEADKNYAGYSSLFTAEAASLYAAGRLFLSMTSGDTALAAVGYKGIGGLDDLVISEQAPDFAQETLTTVTLTVTIPANTVLTIKDANGVVIQHVNGVAQVAPGTKLSLVFEAANGYIMDPVTKEITVGNANEAVSYEDIIAKPIVVTLNWNNGTDFVAYADLTAALAQIAALQPNLAEGATIEMEATATIEPVQTSAGKLGLNEGSWTEILADGSWQGGDIVISGTLSHQWKVAAVQIIGGETLTLAATGVLIAPDGNLAIGAVSGYEVNKTGPDEEGLYTYKAQKKASAGLTSWDDVTDATPIGDLPCLSEADKAALVAAGVSATKVSAWAKGSGNVTFGGTDAIKLDAFLLNVSNTDEAIAAAKAAFKIPSIKVNADGTVTVGVPTGSYNGTVTIKGSATVNGAFTLDVTDASARFFKAFLNL